MRRVATTLFAIAAAAAVTWTPPASAQDDDGSRPRAGESLLAIVGGEVHTGTGAVIRRGTVICRGQKIVAVGADLDVPEGARVIDATGRWVIPGLVAPRGNNFGIQRGRPRGGEKFAQCLDPESRYAELALAAGITAYCGEARSRSVSSSSNAILKPAFGHPELMVVKEPAALTVSWARASATDRSSLERQFGQARKWIDEGRKGRAPVSSTIIAAVARELPVRISASTRSQIKRALDLGRKYDLKLVLFNAHEAWLLPEEIAAAGAIPVVNPRTRRWPTAGLEDRSGSNIEACAILEKAGVRFCVLPPGGFGGGGYGISLGGIAGRDMLTYPLDGGFAIRGGASEDAALRAITLTAAEALGVADRLGSLEAGKDADIVVFQGDPFDYRNVPEITIVSGHVLYERTKSKLFAHLPDPRDGR